jgi:hypothetical protein
VTVKLTSSHGCANPEAAPPNEPRTTALDIQLALPGPAVDFQLPNSLLIFQLLNYPITQFSKTATPPESRREQNSRNSWHHD